MEGMQETAYKWLRLHPKNYSKPFPKINYPVSIRNFCGPWYIFTPSPADLYYLWYFTKMLIAPKLAVSTSIYMKKMWKNLISALPSSHHPESKKFKAHGIAATVKSLQIICNKQNHFINTLCKQPVQPKGCVRDFRLQSISQCLFTE